MNNEFVKPDVRLIEASELMRYSGLIVVHKTPRAGMTVSSIIEASKDGKVLVIEPTNKIAEETIAKEVVKVSGNKLSVCVIYGNKSCVYNKKDIEEHPLLNKLPSMPLYDRCMTIRNNEVDSGSRSRDKCNLENCTIDYCPEFEACQVVRILKDQNINVVVINYHKLSALISASVYHTGTAYAILQEIMKCKTIIVDESHNLELDEERTLELYNADSGYTNVYSPDVDLKGKKVLSELVEANRTLYSNKRVREELDKVVEELNSRNWNDTFERHVIANPLLSYAGVDDAKKTERYIEITRELMSIGRDMSLADAGKYEHLLKVYDVFAVCSSSYLNFTIKKNAGGVHGVYLSATDSSLRENIQKFIKWAVTDDCREVISEHSMIFDTGKADLSYAPSARVPGMFVRSTYNEVVSKRRVIITSATHGLLNKNFLTGKLAEFNSVTFGAGGDPLSTNKMLYIFSDTYGLSAIGRNSRYNREDEYFNFCLEAFKFFGADAIKIVTFNKKQYYSFVERFAKAGYTDLDITYYGADDTAGVSSSKRIMIALGEAAKPATSYNSHAGSPEESKQIRLMRTHQDTCQAWNRVKDPCGVSPSIVFALGVPYWECVNIATWGADREIVLPEEGKRRYSVKVNDEVKIAMPNIIETSGYADMLRKAIAIMKPSEAYQNDCDEVLEYKSIPYTAKIIASPMDLLKAVTSRTDVTAQQFQHESGYKPVKNIFTDNFLKFHLKHELTLGSYVLDSNDETVFGVIDIDCHKEGEEVIAEAQAEALDKFLKDHNIGAVKEKTDEHSYHYWFLFNRCSGGVALAFLSGITNAIGFPDIEVFPDSPTRGDKKKSKLVRYPLGKHQKKETTSSVLVNGEYVESFTDLAVRVYDISAFEALEAPVDTSTDSTIKPLRRAENASETKPAQYVSKVPYAGGAHDEDFVRPCMQVTADTDLFSSRKRDWIRSTVDEYLTAGYTTEEVLQLLSTQNGFQRAKTKAEVKRICNEHKKCASCDKVRKWAGSVDIGCARCTHYRRWIPKNELIQSRRVKKHSPSSIPPSLLCPVSVAD